MWTEDPMPPENPDAVAFRPKTVYLTIQDKPGYGVKLNPDVSRAHLAPGETWWG